MPVDRSGAARAAKAPRIPMSFLRLDAKIPPNNVEKQVMVARRIALRFIYGTSFLTMS